MFGLILSHEHFQLVAELLSEHHTLQKHHWKILTLASKTQNSKKARQPKHLMQWHLNIKKFSSVSASVNVINNSYDTKESGKQTKHQQNITGLRKINTFEKNLHAEHYLLVQQIQIGGRNVL